MAGLDGYRHLIVHTGQHFDPIMSDVFFEDLDIPKPDAHFGISSLSHGAMTGRMLEACEAYFREVGPDLVIAYGDTNSTVAAALAAAKLGTPVCHLEAGLRSFNRAMPEEINRVLTDHCSDLLLCPTFEALTHLEREGLRARAVHVGDVMYDVARRTAERVCDDPGPLERRGLTDGGYVLATVHRAENTDDPARLARLFAYLRDAADGLPVILPTHPRTRAALAHTGVDPAPTRMIEPVGYPEMTRLVLGAKIVMTDSGGLQKEAYFHGKPCVTLRDETEWTETVTHGWNRLWTTPEYAPRRPIRDYGDGHAAQRCAVEIARFLDAATSRGGATARVTP